MGIQRFDEQELDFLHEDDWSPPANILDVWHPPGGDGNGALDLGKGDSSFCFRAVYYGTFEEVEGFIRYMRSRQGRTVDAVTDRGDTREDLLVRRVNPIKREPAWDPEENQPMERCEITVTGIILNDEQTA